MLSSLALAALSFAFQTPAESEFNQLVKANMSPLVLSNTSLGGRGAEVVKDAIGDSRFVVLGEEHFILEVPVFAEALFRTLNRERGFQYLVDENDPYAIEMLGSGRNRKDGRRRAELVSKYPNLIAFSMPQELKLLDSVYEISKAKRPVLGVDQNIGALHILNRLQELAKDSKSKEAVNALLQKVQPIDSKRAGPNSPHYMSSPDAQPDLEKLRSAYTTKSEEADRLLDLMLMSSSVYSLWRQGNSEPDANYRSNFIREQYMKGQLSRQYKQVASDKPRMLAKFGMNHAFRGVNQVGVPALGNFISELAHFEGSRSTGIAITGKSSGAYSNTPWLKQFIEFCSKDQNSVIDLRPIRLAMKSGQLVVDPGTSRFLDGFDILVVIGNPTPMPLS